MTILPIAAYPILTISPPAPTLAPNRSNILMVQYLKTQRTVQLGKKNYEEVHKKNREEVG